MATQLQIRRGTTSQMNAFTGAEGELAVNTTTDTVHVHDGSTAGGFALAKADGSNMSGLTVNPTASAEISGAVSGNYILKLDNTHATSGNGLRIETPSTSSGEFGLVVKSNNGSNNNLVVSNNGDISFYNAAGNSQSLFWDASAESLGIGNSLPVSALDLSGGADGTIGVLTLAQGNGTTKVSKLYGTSVNTNEKGLKLNTYHYGDINAVTITSDGNVLVGKTTTVFGTAGIALRGTVADFTRDGGTPINVNRLTDNGSLIDLHKNSAAVASIGMTTSAGGTRFAIGGVGDPGIIFAGTGVFPATHITASDNSADLGSADYRWKEGFFSSNLNIINPAEDERGLKIEDEQDGGQNLQFLYNASTNNGRIINDGVDQIRFDGANGLSVNTPSFCAYVTSDIATTTSATQIGFGSQIVDTAGGHYNTGNSRFYAPRDGTYFFSTSITFVNGDGADDTMYVTYYVNGVTSALRQFQDNWRGRSGSGIEGHSTYSMVIPLSADDYVTVVYSGISTTSIIIRGTYSKFSGFALSLT